MPTQPLRDMIRRLWNRLSDDEIASCEELRDLFFMAVRKKHGIARAQAEMLLNELKRGMEVAEAA